MAALNKSAFEAKYGTSGTNFPTNTTGDITAATVREFGQDIADSLYNVSVSGALTFAVIEIGDWDMDATASIFVAHGLSDYTKIRSVDIVIRDDSGSSFSPLLLPSGLLGGYYVVNFAGLNPTTIQLNRVSSGFYDNASYDSTSFNRGWITVSYVA